MKKNEVAISTERYFVVVPVDLLKEKGVNLKKTEKIIFLRNAFWRLFEGQGLFDQYSVNQAVMERDYRLIVDYIATKNEMALYDFEQEDIKIMREVK